MIITHELPAHAGAIESLLDTSFGTKRHAKTVYKLRRGVPHLRDLSFVALADDGQGGQRLVATIRYWPVLIGGTVSAIMLGPIAVDPGYRSEGIGAALIRHSLAAAAALGHRICVLVGDAPYYARFGFARPPAAALSLPGPVDPDRFLGLELVPGAMDGLTGMVGRALPPRVSNRPAVGSVAALPEGTTDATAVATTVATAARGSVTRTGAGTRSVVTRLATLAATPLPPEVPLGRPSNAALGESAPMIAATDVVAGLSTGSATGGGRRRLRRGAR